MISSKRPLRVGAPFSFPSTDPAAWAKKTRELNNGAVYAPDISLNDRDYIRAIIAAVKENGLIFAEVGRWGVNLLAVMLFSRFFPYLPVWGGVKKDSIPL